MDAGGARLLREARDQLLDLLADDQHQVGELVDDDDDVGQRLQRRHLALVLARGQSRAISGSGIGLPAACASRTLRLKPARLRTPSAFISS